MAAKVYKTKSGKYSVRLTFSNGKTLAAGPPRTQAS